MKIILTVALVVVVSFANATEMWRGLQVQDEVRCAPYKKSEQYPYSQSLERKIVASMNGHIYGPYTGSHFVSTHETDIEHIVATSEAHDSGLCSASPEKRKALANDLLNLTLAAPAVNRCGPTGKCGLDAGEWSPPKNQCWFANRVVLVKQKYGLSVDPTEAYNLEKILSRCTSVKMVYYPPTKNQNIETVTPRQPALDLYDDNKNGRITCAEARAHNIAPVGRNHIAYKYMYDPDNDGVVCE